ncbi:MAG TPA: DUF6152 family protein [Bryobacteraceae bacterium]|nr:DUF6152 family protein [Bryobacteraceae bacterium]
MFSRLSHSLGTAAVAVSLATIPAWAHHGWAGNSQEEFELIGTVQRGVSLAGPHATMQILADGHVWDLTLAPPARTQAAGLKEGTIPVGATVMIHGHRNLDPKKFEVKTERIMWNGHTFNVYPDRK